MCRMIVAAGKVNCSELFAAAISMAKDETSTHEFNEANGLGSWKHDDGWGISWLQNGEWQQFKSITPIYEDPQVAQFLNLNSEFVMLHVRQKMGSETAMENTHPFYFNHRDVGSFMFCHNGFAGEKFFYDNSFVPKGKTDSERLFYSILTEMQDHDLHLAVQNTLENIETHTGSNIFLSSKDKTIITIKENHYPSYYTMHVGQKDGTIIVSSERVPLLQGFSWESISAGDMISVDHRSLEVKHIENKHLVQKQIVSGSSEHLEKSIYSVNNIIQYIV